ncbi:DUF4214 domain-containing protein [Actinotalea sp.]|uniref:DUF4214 domain-containing protein n=1 Tax=Actinotalea sp. TaxID=1872145 RepID=UPI0035652BF8
MTRTPRRATPRSGRRGLGAVLAAAVALPLVVSGAVTSGAAAATTGLTEVGAPFSRVSLATAGQPLLTFSAGEVWSSAAVGDVTGNGEPNIVVGGGLSSMLRVFTISGAIVASIDVGGIDTASRSGGIQASPALADLNGDGVLDVTIATTSNVLAAYSFRNGAASTIWRRQDAPIVANGPNGMIATPAIAYLDSDDTPDVATGSWGQALSAQSGRTGATLTGWPQWLKDTIWSSPAIGDVDGDGVHDVVVGGDCEGNTIGTQPCGSTGGGYVWAFNRDGSEKWRWFLPGQVIWSSPALADLNGDGAQDVVVGTGGYWGEPNGRVITALNGRTGKVLWQAGTPARVVGSPSLADVTGDGKAEVFVVTHGGYLMSFSGATGAQRWNRCITDSGSCGNLDAGTKTGVALADIDGDGKIEAVTQGEQKLRVYDATTGTLETTARSGYTGTILAPASTPTIAEVNGKTWIVQPVRGRSTSGADELVVTVFRTGSALGAAPWPTFKANSQRTGAAALPAVDSTRATAFVRTIYRDFLDRQPSSAELSTWTNRLTRHQVSRYDVATSLSRSDEWISTVITKFYRDTLGRAPDAAGLAGWVAAAKKGMPVAQIASAFYASPEYFSTVGRSDYSTWVSDLYRKLLLRSPDAGGVAGWVGALRSGMPRDELAMGFYQSPETLAVRVDALYRDLLGRPAEPGGSASWKPFVKAQGDLVLAAALAASDEYWLKASY